MGNGVQFSEESARRIANVVKQVEGQTPSGVGRPMQGATIPQQKLKFGRVSNIAKLEYNFADVTECKADGSEITDAQTYQCFVTSPLFLADGSTSNPESTIEVDDIVLFAKIPTVSGTLSIEGIDPFTYSLTGIIISSKQKPPHELISKIHSDTNWGTDESPKVINNGDTIVRTDDKWDTLPIGTEDQIPTVTVDEGTGKASIEWRSAQPAYQKLLDGKYHTDTGDCTPTANQLIVTNNNNYGLLDSIANAILATDNTGALYYAAIADEINTLGTTDTASAPLVNNGGTPAFYDGPSGEYSPIIGLSVDGSNNLIATEMKIDVTKGLTSGITSLANETICSIVTADNFSTLLEENIVTAINSIAAMEAPTFTQNVPDGVPYWSGNDLVQDYYTWTISHGVCVLRSDKHTSDPIITKGPLNCSGS